MKNMSRGIILVNEETGDRLDFESTNSAANFLGKNYQTVQLASYRCGVVKGWRVFDHPDSMRRQIAEMEKRIEFLEG